MLLLICNKNTGFELFVGFWVSAGFGFGRFGFGHEFAPESEFGSGSGFKLGFRFWVPNHSTRTEPTRCHPYLDICDVLLVVASSLRNLEMDLLVMLILIMLVIWIREVSHELCFHH